MARYYHNYSKKLALNAARASYDTLKDINNQITQMSRNVSSIQSSSDFLLRKPIYEYEMLVENSVGSMCGYHYDLAVMSNFMINYCC